MNVVVTGGTGRIGRYVVEELIREGHEVTVFDRMVPETRVDGATYRVGDHEDLGHLVEVCHGADAIIHLSAIPNPGVHPNPTVFRTNVMGTYNVHEAAVLAEVPFVISTSSQAAYGFAYRYRPFLPHYLPLDEDHPDLSQDAYGLSKMSGDVMVHGYHRRCGLRVCILRPPWVILPEDYERSVRRTLTAPESWEHHLFTYVDVRDLAVAYRTVLEAPESLVQDEVFNVAAADAVATTPLAELLPRLDPAFQTLASDLTGPQPMVSAERLRTTLGWEPRISWRDILDIT